MVGVDAHREASGGQLRLGHTRVRRWHRDERQRRAAHLLAVATREGHHLLRRALLRVNHNRVCAGRGVGPRAPQRLLHACSGDQGFDARDHHEVGRAARADARADPGAELLGVDQLLRTLSAEERILLEAALVLQNARADPELLERAHRVPKHLGMASRVGVVDERLARDGERLLHERQPRRRVHCLDIRQTAKGRSSETRRPHAVKLDLGLSVAIAPRRACVLRD
mmetsp:Transcript_20347/g.41595  ORF Transcript_20347/g.41595 Transcript_20347/m.41595 type:complete len:226 (-) Transcript_20347:223-900(-)